MNVRDTSLSALRSLDLQAQERELLRLAGYYFPAPATFTRKELARTTGWTINRICGRVNSLVAKGALTEHDSTRDGGHLLSLSTTAPSPNSAASQGAGAGAVGTKAAAQVPVTARLGTVAGSDSPRVESVPSAASTSAPAAPGSALDICQKNAERAAARRARMPETTARLDALTEHFPGASVKWAVEGEFRFREAGDPGVVASDTGPAPKVKRQKGREPETRVWWD